MTGRERESEIGGLTPDEAEVWEREQAYWRLFCQGDPGCFAFVAEDFLGWPHNAGAPQDRTALATTLAIYRERPVVPVIRPARLNVAADVAIVHLLRAVTGPDLPPPGEQVPVRVLHTWVRRDGQWYLLGGMGYQPGKT